VLDASGNVVGRQKYYAYGRTRSVTGSIPTDKQYTGYQAEGELYYAQARFYDPWIGRFTAADTVVPNPAEPQSLNRYAYVYNNPMVSVDPTGHYVEGYAEAVSQSGCGWNFSTGEQICDDWAVPPEDVSDAVGQTDPGGSDIDWITQTIAAFEWDSESPYFDVQSMWWSADQQDLINQYYNEWIFNGEDRDSLAALALVEFVGIIAYTANLREPELVTKAPPGFRSFWPSKINSTTEGINHVKQRHVPGGSKVKADSSLFNKSEDIEALVTNAAGVAPRVSSRDPSVLEWIVDAGRPVGTVRYSGRVSSHYTVRTTRGGDLITAFPGFPWE
jgi:RHS repeat-associated protein